MLLCPRSTSRLSKNNLLVKHTPRICDIHTGCASLTVSDSYTPASCMYSQYAHGKVIKYPSISYILSPPPSSDEKLKYIVLLATFFKIIFYLFRYIPNITLCPNTSIRYLTYNNICLKHVKLDGTYNFRNCNNVNTKHGIVHIILQMNKF